MSFSEPSRPDTGAIVVAAGEGRRLGGPPKQFREVGGVPLLLRAIRPFAAHPEVRLVAAVVPAEIGAAPPAWLADALGDRLVVVGGGATRSESVRAGLAALPPECTTVLVHDAARPFPSTATIDAVLLLARSGLAAVAAVPVTDTLKASEVTDDGMTRVTGTVPRHGLWRAQTPQGFPRALLERAHARGGTASDDAMLVEALGETVVVVPDSPLNLKITTAEDLWLAEALATRGTR
jgi:2-C-methyl-D-erythritol 4-phosphate cytidylyltransferase